MCFDVIRDSIASLRGGDYSKLRSSFIDRRRSLESRRIPAHHDLEELGGADY